MSLDANAFEGAVIHSVRPFIMADPQLDPVPNNDLWETAWKLVKEGDLKQYAETYDKILLATSATSTSRALQPDRPKLLLELVDKRAKTLKKGRWGFVISGRKFGVGDIIDKIVTGILYAENLIGQAVRAAGEPHAALAWAGVCLLLPVSTIYLLYCIICCLMVIS
jgi:hypothetical protein